MSLVEASEGRIGTTADQILLACFHYNPDEGRYSADAKRILSYTAGAFVLIGLAISAPFWLSYSQHRPAAKTVTGSLENSTQDYSNTDNSVHPNSDSSIEMSGRTS